MLAVADARLASGDWNPQQRPVAGTGIARGEARFVNEAHAVFTALEGTTLLLAPASGGTILVNWSWPRGQPSAARRRRQTCRRIRC